ncbi:MAG: aminotransferase class I/II-fold pyridoxal phosphate-dependent enzyme [Acidobacteria bacterium]|nr:aminotransferase class I/II-fold pyridoxal phosphate-dependent enzyme [Acidobacteriota bacterium]MBV9476992.1 aminotransferase class I/II-fold pyridoxal phosphate-dependent enzyme [Acidobacteriota bacterium]
MQQIDVSRRGFARLLGTGAAVAALPSFPVLLARTAPGAPVLLNANENPYGPSPLAMRAVQDALANVCRYPDEAERALRERIAKLHDVSTDSVLVGNGSSDILHDAALAFLGGGRKLVTADPTFEALWYDAAATDVVKVPLDTAYAHDLDKMRDAARGAGLVYICNPNNPTGTITPKAAMRAFLDAVPEPTIVLVDEAYHHYATSSDYESVASLAASKPNLLVARTFSKVYAMAGLRCGYAVGAPALIETLGRHQAFNAMNLLGVVAARAALADEPHAASSRKRNSDVRAWTTAELTRLGYRTLPSEANFFMVELRRDAKPVIAAFRERNIRVGRVFPALPQHLRVTVGTQDEMKAFMGAFGEILRA